jgi:hypothetical protein
MHTATLNLAQLSEVVAVMTIARTHNCGSMMVHTGTHADFGVCTLAQCQEWGLLVSAKPYPRATTSRIQMGAALEGRNAPILAMRCRNGAAALELVKLSCPARAVTRA